MTVQDYGIADPLAPIADLTAAISARLIGHERLVERLAIGVLAGGLLTGWLRSLHPVFGRIPEPALWVFDSFGLAAFLALVGLEAGPGFARECQTWNSSVPDCASHSSVGRLLHRRYS